MSLYNMLFGSNPLSGLFLAMIDLTPQAAGRLRDVYLIQQEDGELRIVVFTRNGGGNREHYDDEKEAGMECHCTGCTITHHLPKHPLYVQDEDDDFDCTYANVMFRVPDQFKKTIQELVDANPDTVTPMERFANLIQSMESGNDNPDMARALEVGNEIFTKLKEAVEGDESVKVVEV